MSLVKSTATIGSYTLLSRVLGFLRDVTIASSLGASMLSDAFFVAFKLPNVLRRLFAEGAFNSAFVPLYAGMLTGEGKDHADGFASEAMSFLLVVLVLTAGFFILIMPCLMFVLAPGFDANPAKYDLTVTLTRITMPYIIFISLVSLLGGVLNSHNKFAAVAATPVIMNLCLIIIPFFICRWTPTYAHALAIAVMASGVAQYFWLVWFCIKGHMLPHWTKPRLTAHVKQLLKLIAPVAVGAGAAQINIFIDLSIASFFNGGNSYLYYADRISELPLAVIGIAVGTALLPMLSKQIREGRHEEAHQTQVHAIELALFLSLPAAIALLVIAEPLIHVMYQRGAFGDAAAVATSRTLRALALGLPAFILAKIISPAFYAHKDTKTPFKIAMVCIGINLFFNLALMIPLQYVGMALATSIASWANVIMMIVALGKRNWLSVKRTLVVQIAKTLLAAVAMALVLYGLKGMVTPYMALGEVKRFLALSVMVLMGLLTYLLAGLTLDLMNLRTWVKKRLAKKR